MEEVKGTNNQSTDNKALYVLFLAVFIDLLGFGIIIPIMPFWVNNLIGAPVIYYGILVATYSFFQFLAAPLWGNLSDRLGRRPIILTGLTGTIIGFGILSVTALFFIESLLLLFLSRIIAGIGTAATLSTSQAYISDTTSEADRAKGFGLLGAAFGLGFGFGPAIGGLFTFLAESVAPNLPAGYWGPAVFATGLAITNLLAAIKYLPETLPLQKRQLNLKDESPNKISSYHILKTSGNFSSILILMLIFATITLAFSGMEVTLGLFGENRFGLDELLFAVVLLVVGIVAITTQGGFIRQVSGKIKDAYLISFGLFILIISFLGLSTVFGLASMIFWVIPLAFGSSIATPTLGSQLSKSAPKEIQGTVLGLNQGISSFMRIIGPLLGTFLFEIDVALPYLTGAMILMLTFLLSLYLLRILHKNTRINDNIREKAGISSGTD